MEPNPDDTNDEQQQQQQQPPPPQQQSTQQPPPGPPPAAFGYHIDPHWAMQFGAPPPQGFHPEGYHPAAYGYQQYRRYMEGVPLPPGIPGLGGSTDPLEAVLGPFPCARLKNLPYDATLEDILVLFQGLVVIDVMFLGQGEAHVIFANPMDWQMALQRDKHAIGMRSIDIKHATRAEYYEAIANQHLREQVQGIRLPNDAGAGGEQQSGEGASAMASLWGQGTGMPPMVQQGFAEGGIPKAGAGMPPSGANVPPAPSSESGSGRGSVSGRTGGGIRIGEHTGFLRMRGLPFSATKEEIVKFFENYNPVLDSIVLTYRNDGRATGEAYVGFATAEDSRQAMDLHRKTMGSRYIELFISNKEEQGRALQRFGNR